MKTQQSQEQSVTEQSSPASIPSKIAGIALSATLFILALSGVARPMLRGDIVESAESDKSTSRSIGGFRTPKSRITLDTPYYTDESEEDNSAISFAAGDEDEIMLPSSSMAQDMDSFVEDSASYMIFLQKFPLESTMRMIFHTEVVVCPRDSFDTSFLDTLDNLLPTLQPSRFDDTLKNGETSSGKPFVEVPLAQWSTQSNPKCIQLGYGGSSCNTPCCGSPHTSKNTNYALNSREAVIGNAMGDYKELYLYGVSKENGISGESAYRAVCHGYMGAIEIDTLPTCVSNWAGTDYNPLTNNCNTFTSTVLKCVYGLSDAKPHLGVSDMITVSCPKETDGNDAQQCKIPERKSYLEEEGGGRTS